MSFKLKERRIYRLPLIKKGWGRKTSPTGETSTPPANRAQEGKEAAASEKSESTSLTSGKRSSVIQLSEREFKERIAARDLYYPDHVLDLLYSVLSSPSDGVRSIMLRGPAGVGKTMLTSVVSEILGAKYLYYQCTLGTSEEDFLYKLIPSEKTKSGIEVVMGPLPEALEESKRGPVVVCIDEIDKTRPSADSLLLDFLQNARVSVRMGNEKKTIIGNKDNIIVFLTSNDEREFSEPLLRRCTQLKIPHPPPARVFKLLEKFTNSKPMAQLLTQIYVDTVKAKLRKPATIQELKQLANAIKQLGDRADFSTLLRSFVIKYDDDWQKYVKYVRARPLVGDLKGFEDEDLEDVSEYYNYVSKPVDTVSQSTEQVGRKARMPAFIAREMENKTFLDEVKQETIPPIVEDKSVVVSDLEHYDAAIKIFMPTPSDSPTFLEGVGEFKKDYALLKSLSYDDIVRIVKEREEAYRRWGVDESYADRLLKDSKIFVVIDNLSPLSEKKLTWFAWEQGFTILYYTTKLIRMRRIEEYEENPTDYMEEGVYGERKKRQKTVKRRVYDIAIINPMSENCVIEAVIENGNAGDMVNFFDGLLACQKTLLEAAGEEDTFNYRLTTLLQEHGIQGRQTIERVKYNYDILERNSVLKKKVADLLLEFFERIDKIASKKFRSPLLQDTILDVDAFEEMATKLGIKPPATLSLFRAKVREK